MMIAIPDGNGPDAAQDAFEARERRGHCLAMAANPIFEPHGMTTEDVIARARAFEAFIAG